MKYEEDVEDGGERWSKPHVASLSLHSLFELRSSLLMGAVMLDMDAYHISQVAGKAQFFTMLKSSYSSFNFRGGGVNLYIFVTILFKIHSCIYLKFLLDASRLVIIIHKIVVETSIL